MDSDGCQTGGICRSDLPISGHAVRREDSRDDVGGYRGRYEHCEQCVGDVYAEDVAWNLNRQNAVVNPSLGAAIGAQLGGTFGEAVAVDEYTVKAPLVTDIFWGIPISEFDINDTTVRLDSKNAFDAIGSDGIKLIPIGSGPFTMGEWVPNSNGEVHAVPDHWIERPHIGKFRVVQAPDHHSYGDDADRRR